MIQTLSRFAACCRAWDLGVSTSEVLDCVEHLSLINTTRKELFRLTVKANFAKSRRDQKKFDQIFDLYFDQIPIPVPQKETPAFPSEMDSLFQLLQDRAGEDLFEQAIARFLAKDPADFLKQIRQLQTTNEPKSQVLKSNLSQLTGRLEMMLKVNQMEKMVMDLIDLKITTLPSQSYEQLKSQFANTFAIARQLLTREPGFNNDSLKQSDRQVPVQIGLGEKPLSNLSAEEQQEIKHMIQRLVRKLKDQISRKYAAGRKGPLDVKKTLRQSGCYQGIPLDLKFKSKPPRKGRVVVLCDVSGSVWSTAGFMLYLLYSLQEAFSKVRSFIFVSDMTEITDFFNGRNIDDAVRLALTETDINYHDKTDYGAAFQSFDEQHLNCLNRKTTLIVLGDGRSNYFNPRNDLFTRFRDRTKRVIWLNPEPSETWRTGDSEMSVYLPHCHEARTCRNLDQLEAFIIDLV